MKDIGKNIKKLRIQKGMTQDALANALYVTRQTVSNYETGRSRPDVETVIKIAEVLGTGANAVLYGGEKENKDKKKIIVSLILAFTFIFIMYILKFAVNKLYDGYFLMSQSVVYTLFFRPCLMFFAGFFAVRAVLYALGVAISGYKWAKPVKIVLCVIAAIFGIIILVYGVWGVTVFIKELTGESFSSGIPTIPIFTQIETAVSKITTRFPLFYAIFGGVFSAFWK